MFNKKEESEKIVFDITNQDHKTGEAVETSEKESTASDSQGISEKTENAVNTEKSQNESIVENSVENSSNAQGVQSAATSSAATTADSSDDKKKKKDKKAKKKGKKKGKKWIWILVLIALIAIVVVILNQKSKGPAPIPVVLEEALVGDITQTVDTSGTVQSEETKVYFANVTAPITELNVVAGQGVKAGEHLVSYDTKDIENTIKQAELEKQITKTGADVSITGINAASQKAAEAAKNYDEAVLYVAHYTECVAQYGAILEQAEEINAEIVAAQAKAEKLAEVIKKDPEDKESQKELNKLAKKIEECDKKLEALDYKNVKKQYEMCAGDLEAYKALKSQYEAQKETDPTAGLQKKQQSLVKESADLSADLADDTLEEAQKGVVAEFDGIVSSVDVVKGQTASVGSPLFTICNAEKVKVAISISKYDLDKVQVGQKATVTINGNEYNGEIASISRIATTNETGGIVVSTDVHITNPDDNIVLGIEGKVKINTAEEKGALLVPSSCVNYASDGVFCYTVEDGIVKKVDVETGIADDNYIQILSGLKEGDKIIAEVSADIQEGVAVVEMDPKMQQMMDTMQNAAE